MEFFCKWSVGEKNMLNEILIWAILFDNGENSVFVYCFLACGNHQLLDESYYMLTSRVACIFSTNFLVMVSVPNCSTLIYCQTFFVRFFIIEANGNL